MSNLNGLIATLQLINLIKLESEDGWLKPHPLVTTAEELAKKVLLKRPMSNNHWYNEGALKKYGYRIYRVFGGGGPIITPQGGILF